MAVLRAELGVVVDRLNRPFMLSGAASISDCVFIVFVRSKSSLFFLPSADKKKCRVHRPASVPPRRTYVVINQLFLSPPAARQASRVGRSVSVRPQDGALVGLLSSAGTAGAVAAAESSTDTRHRGCVPLSHGRHRDSAI